MKKSEKKHAGRVVLVLFLILVIGALLLIYVNNRKYEQLAFDFHGFDVVHTADGYRFRIFINENNEPNFFTLRSDPRTLENVTIGKNIVADLLRKEQIYVVIDPYENLTGLTTMAALEIDKIVENNFLFGIPVNTAFTKPYERVGLEVITCENANATLGVIWLRLGSETQIFSENGCVVMEGEKEEDLMRTADRLILALLKVF